MTKACRGALLLDRGLAVVRGVLQGIRVYASGKPHWILRDCPPRSDLIAHVRDWKPHGVIVGLVVPKIARALEAIGAPLVDIAYSPTVAAANAQFDFLACVARACSVSGDVVHSSEKRALRCTFANALLCVTWRGHADGAPATNGLRLFLA